ncbi:hypothetical protein NJB1604_42660 [Mycobacterium marinum]|nr:hypothetical protein NJB1604_42660 [Mycobacterium marinum]
MVDGSLHGPEHPGHGLPLVEENRFGLPGQNRVWIRTIRHGVCLSLEAHNAAGMAGATMRNTQAQTCDGDPADGV